MSRPSCLALRLAAAALVLGSAVPALAQPSGEPPRARLTPAQQQKIFPDLRSLALKDRRARIAILQKGERCVAAAGNGDALRTCMREERTAYQQQRSQHRSEMRSLFERNGIPMPDWSQRGDRRPWGKPAGPAGPGGPAGEI